MSRHGLATAVREVVGSQLVDRHVVEQRGEVLQFHNRDTCAVYDGVRAVVQQFRIPGGIGMSDVDEVLEGQQVLDAQHAEAVFALIAPNTPSALLEPLIANVMGHFDRQDGLVVVDATLFLFERASAFEQWRLPSKPRSERPIVSGRFSRMGRGIWWANDSDIPRVQGPQLTKRQVERIHHRRREIVTALAN